MLRDEYIYSLLPQHVITVGRWNDIVNHAALVATLGTGSVAWPTNNRAFYIPVFLPAPFTIARFMVSNGSNITGNVDVGLYSADGTRLVSTGSTARSGGSAVQYVDITDQSFPLGNYYLALVGSSTSGTYTGMTLASASHARVCGVLQEDLGANTLPTTMTPVATTTGTVFAFGFTQSGAL